MRRSLTINNESHDVLTTRTDVPWSDFDDDERDYVTAAIARYCMNRDLTTHWTFVIENKLLAGVYEQIWHASGPAESPVEATERPPARFRVTATLQLAYEDVLEAQTAADAAALLGGMIRAGKAAPKGPGVVNHVRVHRIRDRR